MPRLAAHRRGPDDGGYVAAGGLVADAVRGSAVAEGEGRDRTVILSRFTEINRTDKEA
jgi:hypothetical protein